jgi:hypothetical protein
MRLALRSAGVAPEEVDYVNPHGSSTPLNDATETLASRQVLGDQAYRAVSGTKPYHGHALGASGAIEVGITCLALEHDWIPPVLNFETAATSVTSTTSPVPAATPRLDVCLSNSFGFGGINASLVIRSPRGATPSRDPWHDPGPHRPAPRRFLRLRAQPLPHRGRPGPPLPPDIIGLPPASAGWRAPSSSAAPLTLYLIEAVVDKVRHADSLWDTVHTFIRPPAAALLAVGALGRQPASVLVVAAAAFAFVVALAAHGTKAGLRWPSTPIAGRGPAGSALAEDVPPSPSPPWRFLEFPATRPPRAPPPGHPRPGRAPLLASVPLGMRCLNAWFRTLFTPARWRDCGPRSRARLRNLLDDVPIGARRLAAPAPASTGSPAPGAYRNGWLVGHRPRARLPLRTLMGTAASTCRHPGSRIETPASGPHRPDRDRRHPTTSSTC